MESFIPKMNITGYGSRYLKHEDFLKLCSDLELKVLSSGWNERWLELLEKEKILFPVCRIIYPVSYLKTINEVMNDPSNPQYGKDSFYLPDKYEIVHHLKTYLENYSWDRNLFHILDKKKSKVMKYIRNPNRTKFHEWKSYKKYGIENYESIAKHYYAYWQAYHFYEVTKACTLNYMINVFDEGIRSELRKRKISLNKIFMGTVPHKYDKIKGDFWDQSKNFEVLSFYIQTLRKYDNLVFWYSQEKIDRFGYLDVDSSSIYNRNRIRLAKLTIKKYAVNTWQVFDFLKFLCEKFDDYKKQKQEKLVQSIKQDIGYLIHLIQDGFDLKFEYINQKLGRVISDFKNTLDVIFPPMFSDERENVLYTLNSSLSSDLNFNRFENVSRDEIKEFLNYMDVNNLQLFYHSLGQINLVQLRDKTVYLHIFYLSLLLENMMKLIGRKSRKRDLELFLSKYREMKKTLNKFFNSEGWIHSLSSHWSLTNVDYYTNIKEKISKDISSTMFHKKDKWSQIIKMFLVCGIARNLSAHEHSIVYNIDRETYLILINNIVSAIWFTWKYALEKGYISSAN